MATGAEGNCGAGGIRLRALTSAAAALAILLLIAAPATAQTATDGDTIKLDGTTYRLWGIDAPETRQACADAWPAGIEADRKLAELVAGRTITCEARDKDRYGRIVALCRADGRDLGDAMVRAGMAWAFTRYSSDYVGQEREAIGAKLGVHAHDCEKPWDWRRQLR